MRPQSRTRRRNSDIGSQSSLDSEIKRLHHELSLRDSQIRSLNSKLAESQRVNKTLNVSLSKLTEQVEVYMNKIQYEKNKNRQRGALFSKREQDLTETLAQKSKEI